MVVAEIRLVDKSGKQLWIHTASVGSEGTLSVGRSSVCDVQCRYLSFSEWSTFAFESGFIFASSPGRSAFGYRETTQILRRQRKLIFRLSNMTDNVWIDLMGRPDFSQPSILSFIPCQEAYLNPEFRLRAAQVLMDERIFGTRDRGHYSCALGQLISVYSGYCADFCESGLSTREQLRALRHNFWMLASYVYAEGPLTRWMRSADVREVLIHGDQHCWIERSEGLEPMDPPFCSWEDLWAWLVHHATIAGREIVNARGCSDFHLGVGARVHVALAPVAGCPGYVSIRRHAAETISLETMIENRFLSEAQVEMLSCMVRDRKNILICGSTSSGKTTLLRALAERIRVEERILVLEDVPELNLSHANAVYLRTVESVSDHSKGTASLESLLREALRMRPDRLVVGECRGDEAFALIQALNTGHKGSFSTLHANSPSDALRRLEALVLRAEPSLNSSVVQKMIRSAFDVVVFLDRQPGRPRCLAALQSTEDLV